MSPRLKALTEYGPLGLFLVVYFTKGMIPATIALVVATLVALVIGFYYTRKVAMMPLITAIVVAIFGGLTIYLNNDLFIKLKPTIVYACFAVILLAGMFLDRPFLKMLMGQALPMEDAGWRTLTIRFIGFFVIMALANEVVRRVASDDMWVLWKVPGSIVVTILFMVAQAPVLLRHKLPDEQKPE